MALLTQARCCELSRRTAEIASINVEAIDSLTEHHAWSPVRRRIGMRPNELSDLPPNA